MAREKTNCKNNKATMLDLVVFLRENSKRLELSHVQQCLIMYIFSRNGSNPEYAVNQKLLAQDLNIDARTVRQLSASLIEKNIIILNKKHTKKGRENSYSISSFLCSTTGSLDPVVMELTKIGTGSRDPVGSGSRDPVVPSDTNYINKKLITRNNTTQRAVRSHTSRHAKNPRKFISPAEGEGGFFSESFAPTTHISRKSNSKLNETNPNYPLPFTSEHFENFLKEHPHYDRSTRNRCAKIWTGEGLEEIGGEIVADVIKRKSEHAPWLDCLAKQRPWCIPKAHTYLETKIWTNDIRPQQQRGENSNAKNVTGTQHYSGSPVMQRYFELCEKDRRRYFAKPVAPT